jgi:hypothetical protein
MGLGDGTNTGFKTKLAKLESLLGTMLVCEVATISKSA